MGKEFTEETHLAQVEDEVRVLGQLQQGPAGKPGVDLAVRVDLGVVEEGHVVHDAGDLGIALLVGKDACGPIVSHERLGHLARLRRREIQKF